MEGEMTMEDQRYYVPEISEFHVDFEYEINISPKPYLYDGSWIKAVYGEIPANPDVFKANLKEGIIRVKYLDHDDITKCGWEQWAKSPHVFQIKKSEDEGFLLDFDPEYTQIFKYPDPFKDQKEKLIFAGTIRNKSELKFLMKMLGIK